MKRYPQPEPQSHKVTKSQHRVKSIRLEIDATFWGEEYAAGAEKSSYEGIVDRWLDNTKGGSLVVGPNL